MDDLTPRMFIAAREHKPRWGTASLEAKATVILHVEGHSANPIHISLTHQLVLGRVEGTHQDPCLNLAAYGATEKGMSHQHAALELIGKTVMLTDLSSTNGTFLNGQQLSPKQPVIVRSSDEIRLGQLVVYIYYENKDVLVHVLRENQGYAKGWIAGERMGTPISQR